MKNVREKKINKYMTIPNRKPKSCMDLTVFSRKDQSKISTAVKKGKLGTHAMKRVAVGAHLPTSWLLSLRNAQTIETPTAWTAISCIEAYNYQMTNMSLIK